MRRKGSSGDRGLEVQEGGAKTDPERKEAGASKEELSYCRISRFLLGISR